MVTLVSTQDGLGGDSAEMTLSAFDPYGEPITGDSVLRREAAMERDHRTERQWQTWLTHIV